MLPAEHRVRRDRQGQEQPAAGKEGEPGRLGVTGPAEHCTGHPGDAGQRQQHAGSPGASYDEQRDAADDVRQADEREDDEDRVCNGGRHRPLPRPPSRARTIAAARSATSSLAKMLVRLLLTVFGRQEQLLGDHRGPPPVREQGEDLPLPLGELRKRFRRRRDGWGGEEVEHAGGDARAEDGLTGNDRADGTHDLVLFRPLEQIAPGASLHRGEDGRVVVEHREDQHGSLRDAGPDPPGRFDPVDPGHPDVHEDHIGTQQLHLADRGLAVGGFAHHLEPVDGRQQRAQPPAHHRMVVGDHQANGHVLMMGPDRRG